MKKHFALRSVLAGIMAAWMLFATACGGGSPTDTSEDTKTPSGDTNAETTVDDTEKSDVTEGETTPTTDGDVETESNSPEQDTVSGGEESVDTEEVTEFIPSVEVPGETPPDLTTIFTGENTQISMEKSFANKALSAIQADRDLTFTGGSSAFLAGPESAGLSSQTENGWGAVGFSDAVTTQEYTYTVKLATYENDRSGNYNALMAGVRVLDGDDLFIDSGIWFSFRENTMAMYIKGDGGNFERVVTGALPTSAADGLTLKITENADGMSVYVNDTLMATLTVDAEQALVTVKSAEGRTLGTQSTKYVAVENYGYARVMAHYANGAFESMKLEGKTQARYQPVEKVFAFSSDVPYAFCEKEQFLAGQNNSVWSELYYADAEMLAKMFGFDANRSGDVLTLTKDGVDVVFEAGKATVDVEGKTYVFPTTVKQGDTLMIPVVNFVSMMGYCAETQDRILYIAGNQALLGEEAKNAMKDRFDLYRDVVYNYDDVECDQTGVGGRYKTVAPSDRLVGVAYSTWHQSARSWGTGTWDIPLYGGYVSNDPEVIYRHGVQLRDAGVDFVFVDWSNNTEYDPTTMSATRPDFRMIEEATDMLFDIWATIEGAPKICIFVGPGHNGPGTITNGAHQKKVDQVYNDYVNNPARKDMYFCYLNKPLLICYGATPTQYGETPATLWDDDRFTVRWMTGYVGQQSNLFNATTLASPRYWSWEERGAQTYAVYGGYVEAVTITAATRAQGKEGDEGYIPAAGREDGATLKRQFQRASDLGARFAIVVSWNEWTTGEQPSPEISKDMEPSVIHGTFYYDLLREQIKKFKGLV